MCVNLGGAEGGRGGAAAPVNLIYGRILIGAEKYGFTLFHSVLSILYVKLKGTVCRSQ